MNKQLLYWRTSISSHNTMKRYLIMLNFVICVSGSKESIQLYNDLFQKNEYHSVVMPINREGEIMNVTVKFIPRGISEFNEVAGQISVAMGVDLRWKDAYLQWNPRKYGGRTNMVFPEDMVWTPQISLSNPTDRTPIFPEDPFPVRVYFNGQMIWIKGGTIRSTCKPNVKYYPFDVHTCYIKVITLDHIKTEINLIAELRSDVYENFGEWDVFEGEAYSSTLDLFSSAIYKFKIKRRPEFSILSICIPILCLGMLNACVFLIPPESGERISFAITVLLSFAVFMTIVSATMPKNSDPVPILCCVLIVMMCESGVIVLLTIIGLRLYFKDDNAHVPERLQTLVKGVSKNKGNVLYVTDDKNHETPNCPAHKTDDIGMESNVSWTEVGKYMDTVCFWVSFSVFIITVSAYAVTVKLS